jgi:hypothetical protein
MPPRPPAPDEEVTQRLTAAYAELAGSRFGSAVRALQQLAADHPASHAAQHACGAVLSNLGQAAAAEPYLRRALALDPQSPASQVALAFALLALGRYAEAWPLYEARYELAAGPAKPVLPIPEWRGEPLAGRRLLVWPDEGLGDQIQFARFASALQRQGLDVTLACSPALARLFAASLGVPVIPLGEAMPLPDADCWTLGGFLPGRLGLSPQAAPAPPYLTAPPARLIPGARIGLMTRGNPRHLNDAHRSLPAAEAGRLTAVPGAISLHPDDTGAADMAETAAIVAGLELVISVDTSLAHLAAALGKPTWVLLPTIGLDWRWGLGDRTPWYPQARLFRQPRINDWPAVIEAVLAALPAAA